MKITRRNFLSATGAGTCAAFAPLAAAQESLASGGLWWPASQALPSFGVPHHLDAANIQQLTGDQQVLLTTLQGIVNRREPRLYWFLQGDNTDQTWLNTIDVPYSIAGDPLSLIAKYRDEIRGAIVYDPNVPDTINVATSLAGLNDAVIATGDLANQYKLPILEDLRGRFANKIDAYNWLLDNYWSQLTPRLLTGISPASPNFNPSVSWITLFKVTQPVTDASNNAVYTADLSGLLGSEAVYVRYQDAYSNTGWGPSVSQVTVIADGNTIASFQPGTAAEEPFLYEADSSSLASGWRFADNSTYFVYRFVSPAGTKVLTFQTEMWNQFYVTATNQPPLQYVPVPNLRDYIVATKALVFWLDPLEPAEAALFAQILEKVRPDTPYLGWFVDGNEDPGVTLCSQNGVVVCAADYLNNATVFGGTREPSRPWQPKANMPTLQNKVYVTLTMSEGDNLQYVEHRMRTIWDDPNRGRVPTNWSINPLLLDAAPAMLNYYQTTQSPNDFLVAGPSGAGYTYPGDWPSADLPDFAQRTGSYMQRTGMNVIYTLNRLNGTNIDFTNAVAQQYVEHVHLLGIVGNWVSQSQLSTPAGLPVMTQVGISTVAQGQAALASATQSWNGTSPLFVALGVLAWNMAPTDVSNLVSTLGSQYEVVRADVFFDLLRKSLGLQ
jgi:hypothetical protein